MIFTLKTLKNLTKVNSKFPYNERLELLTEEYKFLHPKVHSLAKEIIKIKTKRFLFHRLPKLCILTFLICLLFVGTITLYNYLNFPRITIGSKVTQIIIPEDTTIESYIVVDNIINPAIEPYFKAISMSEADTTKLGDPKGYKTVCFDTTSSALGRYQMLKSTRDAISIKYLGFAVSDEKFKNTPWLQDIFMWLLIKDNKEYLKDVIKKYDKKFVNGYFLTECGLISMSHATGAGFVTGWVGRGCTGEMPEGAPGSYKRLTLQGYKFIFN